ncbi:MAG TPA: flagellar basal body L-ring protein FlgH [Terriglobales bacterium]|nr:flagellar basal body L-ring protein FlgH [Terriglobales bacterium]
MPAVKTVIATLTLAGSLHLMAQARRPAPPPPASPAQAALDAYLVRVRQIALASTTTPGSLWNPNGRYANLSTDYKAQNLNDLITIHIMEATQATGSGTLQSKRQFDATSGFTGLFGALSQTNRLQNLFSPASSSELDGQAQTASTSQLETSLTGRVVDLLPNGFLVVEAVRTISMNNQQETVIVHGVVRPADIAPDNSVLSTQVGELEVDLQGKGVISENTRPPVGWMRLMLHWLTF